MKKLLTVFAIFIVLLIVELDGLMYMSPHVEQHLSELNTNYPQELTACLDYIELSNNLFIYNYNVPTIHTSSESRVMSEKCDSDQARYHNHPYQNLQDSALQDYYYKYTGDSLENDHQMLYLSGTDIWSSAWSKNQYVFVGTKGEYAWWTVDQVRDAYRDKKNILLIQNNQTTLNIKP